MCGSQFEARRSTARYCSGACSMRHFRSARPSGDVQQAWAAHRRAHSRHRNRLLVSVQATRPCHVCGASRTGLKTFYGKCRDCLHEYSLSKKVPCADCGEPMWRSSLPVGEATCRSCRNRQRDELLAAIATRRAIPRPKKARQYKSKGSSTERGYGSKHRLVREALLATFVPGTPCGFCDQPMLTGQALDLDHSDPATRLDGQPGDRLTHATCNRRAPNVRGRTMASCEICGDEYVARPRQRTCGRACGSELQRRNRVAA